MAASAFDLARYAPGSVTSADGTTIGYRRFGHGPGVVLVHGGMQAAQNFTKLALALADTFTVYVPDRRGRGRSGPFGPRYCMDREREDLSALISQTGATDVFGLSSGALIVLRTALSNPSIRRVALYEPPFPVADLSLASWGPRFDDEVGRGDLASALVTVLKGTGDAIDLHEAPAPRPHAALAARGLGRPAPRAGR